MIIQVIAGTGQTVYIFIWNSLLQVWNGTAFETYNVAHWANYAIATTEQAGSGSYLATVPADITTPGNYSWAGYIRLAGSPAVGDTPVNQGPFTIPTAASSFIVPGTLAGLITNLRILVQDAPDSKTVWQETLGGSDQPSFPVNGVNTTFRLKKAPLSDYAGAPSYIWISIVGTGAVQRSQVGFTIVDPVNGIISFSVAPNPGAGGSNGVYADYNFEWFTDAKYAQFLYQAAQMVLAGTTDPTVIPNGLNDAMLQYSIAQFWFARASQFAEQYKSSGGEAMEEVQTVTQAYMGLGKAANMRGDFLKLDYYKDQGQREKMAFGNLTSYPPSRFDKITPRH